MTQTLSEVMPPPVCSILVGARVSPVQHGWTVQHQEARFRSMRRLAACLISCPWHMPVTVLGLSHLLVSDVLGFAESSPLFCKF